MGVETIALTDTARLVIEVDQDAENPRSDWDMMTGFVKIEGKGDSRLEDVPAVHAPPIPIADAHERFDSARYIWVPSVRSYTIKHRRNPEDDTLPRWARIFHGLQVEYDSEHGGYWFVDPVQLEANFPDAGDGMRKRSRQIPGAPINTYEHYLQPSLEVQAEVIRQEQETYRQWAQSEVYGVILEREVTRHISTVHQDESVTRSVETDWEQAEALWGCYLDDEYTAQQVAREHFTLTHDEEAGLAS